MAFRRTATTIRSSPDLTFHIIVLEQLRVISRAAQAASYSNAVSGSFGLKNSILVLEAYLQPYVTQEYLDLAEDYKSKIKSIPLTEKDWRKEEVIEACIDWLGLLIVQFSKVGIVIYPPIDAGEFEESELAEIEGKK